jgi:glycosyltransferase involved in cell wall biosynthesis
MSAQPAQLPQRASRGRPPVTPTQEMSVSVVLCAYTLERWDDLFAAVMSVRAQTVKAHEIIVVIDNNTEMLASVRRSLAGVTVLHNEGPRGAGQARNLGVQRASGSVIAFLDDDARADHRWIENALRAFEDQSTIGVGGTIDPDWEGSQPRWMAREFYWTVGCTYTGLPDSRTPVRNLIAANMFVRRQAFLELGGFRAGFGKTGARSGTEETELCIRAQQRWPHAVWIYDPRVRVMHRVPHARSRIPYFIQRCYDEGIAKASVVGFVGGRDGLAAERAYTRRTLPIGVMQGVAATLGRADLAGLARSMSILAGLASASAGYAVGSLRRRASRAPLMAGELEHA